LELFSNTKSIDLTFILTDSSCCNYFLVSSCTSIYLLRSSTDLMF